MRPLHLRVVDRLRGARDAETPGLDNQETLRQRILYAEEIWKRQRLFPLFFITVGTVLTGTVLFTGTARFTGSSWIWPLYILSGLVYGGGLVYYRRRSQAEVTEVGLKISNLLRSLVIPYDSIRLVRVQPLARHFEDSRKKFIRPINRGLLQMPALFVRLRADEAYLADIKRKLGNQLVDGDTVALPLPDPDAMSWEVSSRLPDRSGPNLGGKRRRKRSR
jgi:hypothetical protein